MPSSSTNTADSNKEMAALVKQRKSKSRSKQKHRRRKKKQFGKATSPVPEEVRRASALEYLYLWEGDREAWSFKKKLQFWLLNNMYDKKQIGKCDFKVLLMYLKGLQGYQREKLIKDAKEITEKYSRANRDDNRTARTWYKRAMKILRLEETKLI